MLIEPPSRLAAARVGLQRCPGNLQPAAHRAVGPQRRAGGVGVRQLSECATEPVDGRRSGGGDRRRVGEQLADLPGDADRQAERRMDDAEHRVDRARWRGRRRFVGSRRAAGGLGGTAGQVDVLHRHAHTVDPVGDRVVHLRHQRRLAALQPLDDEELPERAGAVERVEHEQAGEVEELAEGARRRQGDAAHVEVDVEVGVVGPDRGAERGGVGLNPPAEPGHGVHGASPCAPAGGRSPAGGRGSSPPRTSTPGTGPSRRATSAPRRRSSGGRPRRRPSDGWPQRPWAAPDRRPSAQPATSSGRRQVRSRWRRTRRATSPRAAPVASPATTSDPWWMRT